MLGRQVPCEQVQLSWFKIHPSLQILALFPLIFSMKSFQYFCIEMLIDRLITGNPCNHCNSKNDKKAIDIALKFECGMWVFLWSWGILDTSSLLTVIYFKDRRWKSMSHYSNNRFQQMCLSVINVLTQLCMAQFLKSYLTELLVKSSHKSSSSQL